MSDDTTPTPAPDTTPAETPDAKAKRARTVFPFRILREDGGAFFLMRDAPEFSEVREAHAWIRANGAPGLLYVPARLGPALRAAMKWEEVAI